MIDRPVRRHSAIRARPFESAALFQRFGHFGVSSLAVYLLGPTVKAAIPLIAPDVLKDLPTAPENTKNTLVMDAEFWGDNAEELNKRFNDWIASGT